MSSSKKSYDDIPSQKNAKRRPAKKATSAPSLKVVVEENQLTPQTELVVTSDLSVPVVSATEENTVVVSSVEQVNEHVEFYAKLNQILSIVSQLKKDYKNIEAKNARDLKIVQKAIGKKKKRQGTRTPSGFVKPTPISEELANFLGKEKGCEMARTAVTKEINNYINLHSLKDKTNGRKIIPDEKLNSLLKIQEGDELTYFNLQKYMSPHFFKASSTLPAK